MREGAIIWFTGLSGAGKTTLGRALAEVLKQEGRACARLDGDELRQRFAHDLGFSQADRDRNVRRAAELARDAAREGQVAVVSLISPYRAAREEARALSRQFLEVHCDCPLSVLKERDPKGLYARALRGELRDFTGVDAPYEPPAAPELHLRTDLLSEPECLARLVSLLRERGVLNKVGP